MPKKNGKPTIAEKRQEILQQQLLTEGFIENAKNFLDWKLIARKFYLPDDKLEQYEKFISWTTLGRYQNLSDYILIKYHKKISSHVIINNQKNISYDLLNVITPNLFKRDWDIISNRFELSIETIEKYYELLDLDKLLIKHLNKSEYDKFISLKIIKSLM